jgi:drug/metabolite transporter (DMT)-like permease
MDANFALALVLGTCASLAMNVGKGIQKWKVDVLKHKTAVLQSRHRKDFIVWGLGALLTALAGPLYSVAFKFSDQPSIITSLGGIGLIGVLIFSALVLKEHITNKKIGGAVLIIVGTVLVNLFAKKAVQQSFDAKIFIYVASGYLVFFLCLFFVSMKWKQFTGKCFSITAGTFLGTSMILADVALVSSGGDLFAQFKGLYIYVALICGSSAFITTQFALMREEGSVVIPIIHSMVIMISVMLEFVVFKNVLTLMQMVGIAVIIVGVFLLTTKNPQEHTLFE